MLGPDRPIIRPSRIRYTSAEHLCKDGSIRSAYPTFAVYVKLCLYHALFNFDFFTFRILKGNFVRLVATAPEHEICTPKVLRLFLGSHCLYKLNSFLSP